MWNELALVVPSGQHYLNAPIVEAIVEIRVEQLESPSRESLHKGLPSDGFLAPDEQHEVTAEVTFDHADIAAQARKQLFGLVAVREDQRRVVRSGVDRFSFSWLKPYEDWRSLEAEAIKHWDRYRDACEPRAMTRLGVRFINRIELDRPSVEVRDYLRTGLDISPYLPQLMLGFLIQVDIPLTRFEAVTRITSGLAVPEKPEGTAIILDIDVWKTLYLDLSLSSTPKELLTQLGSLHDAKNYVFEACITDATRGVIN